MESTEKMTKGMVRFTELRGARRGIVMSEIQVFDLCFPTIELIEPV